MQADSTTLWIGFGACLQSRFALEVIHQPGGFYRARGQPSHAHEGDDVLGFCLGQHAFEVGMGVAFLGDGERRAELYRTRAQRQRGQQFFMTVDTAADDDGKLFTRNPRVVEQLEDARQCFGNVKPGMRQLGRVRCAEMAACVQRMLDHDGVRQSSLARPFLQHDSDAACVRQDRNQRDIGIAFGQFRQIQWQPRAHHDGLRA